VPPVNVTTAWVAALIPELVVYRVSMASGDHYIRKGGVNLKSMSKIKIKIKIKILRMALHQERWNEARLNGSRRNIFWVRGSGLFPD